MDFIIYELDFSPDINDFSSVRSSFFLDSASLFKSVPVIYSIASSASFSLFFAPSVKF
jgi:hypothetical protein